MFVPVRHQPQHAFMSQHTHTHTHTQIEHLNTTSGSKSLPIFSSLYFHENWLNIYILRLIFGPSYTECFASSTIVIVKYRGRPLWSIHEHEPNQVQNGIQKFCFLLRIVGNLFMKRPFAHEHCDANWNRLADNVHHYGPCVIVRATFFGNTLLHGQFILPNAENGPKKVIQKVNHEYAYDSVQLPEYITN